MASKKISILIADDHQIIVDGIRSLLEGEKNIIVAAEAGNGKEAIAVAEKNPVDIILMDVEMPLLNGCDATAIITARFPKIKVIALTTYDEKAIISKMLNAGASGYILKNINKKILLEAINTVSNGGTYFSSEIPIVLATKSAETTPVKHDSPLSFLSTREVEVLKHIGNGLSNSEIAEKLFLSPKTVETHRTNIMRKLNIHNVVGLVKYAIKSGLVD